MRYGLAPFVHRDADHGDHGESACCDSTSSPRAEDVEAAGDDHVLLGSRMNHGSRAHRARDIAGMQPAVLEGFGGLFGRFQYSASQCDARTQISPASPVSTHCRVSRILVSQREIGKPQERNSPRLRIMIRLGAA